MDKDIVYIVEKQHNEFDCDSITGMSMKVIWEAYFLAIDLKEAEETKKTLENNSNCKYRICSYIRKNIVEQ